MRGPLQRFVHRGLELTGLIGPLHRRQERRLADARTEPFEDRLPMPPPELMVLVAGAAGPAWFSERGRADGERFRAAAAAHGVDLASGLDVLDFGCGCGRIARWLAPQVLAAGGSFHGFDYNRRLVDWCAANLVGDYRTNRLRPPLRMDDGSVDVAYAYSVLTHLREDVTRAWLDEIARVLRPSGLALLTFHDETYAEHWGPEPARALLQRQGYAVLNDALQGSNYMSAWTTRAHMAQIAGARFDVLEIVPGGVQTPDQAVAVLRRKP
jgi:SAM-dependent methyltransferase